MYTGENPPHMWWELFEQKITWAFNTYTLQNSTQYANEEKVRILMRKIKSDLLSQTKESLQVTLVTNPQFTYTNAIQL